MSNKVLSYDVLIIGTGAAGLGLALSLPEHLNIAMLSKQGMMEGSTYYAQGGVSAVLDKNDSIISHKNDTIKTGADLSHDEIVELVVSQGKKSIEWLMSKNVNFSETYSSSVNNKLHLTKEGGHSHRRVVHADDSTGKEIQTSLSDLAIEKKNITILEHFNALDLITEKTQGKYKKRITGCYALDTKKGVVIGIQAPFVTLATGGASKVYFLILLPVMVLRWHGAQVVESLIWNLCNFIPLVSTTLKLNHFLLVKLLEVREACCYYLMVNVLCRNFISLLSLHQETLWQELLTIKLKNWVSNLFT